MDREVNQPVPLIQPSQTQAAFSVLRRAAGEWWDHWFPLATLGVAWALACLTVILAPPATLGLAYALRAIPQGHAPTVTDWWQGTRRCFGQAWLLALLNTVAFFLFWTNAWFYGQFATPLALFLQWLFVPIALIWLIIQFYGIAFLVEQERRHVGVALRNGLYLTLAAPFFTLIVGGVALGLLFLGMLLVAPLLLGLPALILLIGYFAVCERLAAYQLR